MLVLSRQREESIVIGDDIEVTVVDLRGDKVRLGITAPGHVSVHRKEIYETIKRENRAASQIEPADLPTAKPHFPSNRGARVKTLHARTPARIDFGGGGTDVAPYCFEHHGVVVNAAINYHAHATLVPRDDAQIHINAMDLGKREVIRSLAEIKLEGDLDLVKACIRRAGPRRGFELTTYSEIPIGSGLSSSAAIAVLVCAICTEYEHGGFDQAKMAHLAHLAERDDLNHWTGQQDQFAAACGGWQFLEFVGDDVPHEPAPLTEQSLRQLEKNLLLVYTGKAHLAGNIHLDILADYKSKTGTVLPGMHGLKAVARQMQTSLREGDLAEFAALLNENWKYHQMLHPSCCTPELEKFMQTGLDNGALGGKVCGAGGGGCIVFYARDNEKPRLARALAGIGGQVLPFSFDTAGTIAW